MRMRFDDLTTRIRSRIDGYRRSGDERLLFGAAVESEVEELADACRAADPARPSDTEVDRQDVGWSLLGTLFFLRFDSRPLAQRDLTDLTYALFFHWQKGSASADVPGTLGALLPGPAADVTSQVGAAVALFQHSMADLDPMNLRMTLILLETVVAATPAKHREYSLRMGYLVGANLVHLRRIDDLRAADEAIELSQRCLDVLSRRHPDRAWFLAAITSARMARVRHGSHGDLKHAIATGERALKARERRVRLRRMNRTRTGDPFLEALADLAYSYELSPFRPQLDSELAEAYELRYRLARGPKDLDRAISLRERAVAMLNGKAPDFLAGLADSYIVRYDRDGRRRDLHQAVAAATKYLEIARPDHPNQNVVPAYAALARLLPMGERLPDRLVPAPWPDGGWFKRLWLARLAPLVVEAHVDDADAVITLGERALGVPGLLFALDETVQVPNLDDPATDRTVIALSELYAVRFVKLGTKSDIDRAVALIEQMTGPQSVADLGTAAWAHKLRFAASHSTQDLDIAVALSERALQAANDDDHGRARISHELADVYRMKARTTGQPDFLRRAAELSEQLLADTPPDSPQWARRTAAVGDTHLEWFHVTADRTELDRAIDHYQRAADVEGHPSVWTKLGNAHHFRFRATGDVADLRLAIDNFALSQRTDDDTVKSVSVAAYCAAYRHLFDAAPEDVRTDDLEALAEACTAPMRGEPVHQALACQAVGSLALAMNRPRLAVRLLNQAVDLLGTATWRETDWPEQEALLGGFQGLASESINAQLAAGDPVGAVEAAERSRALILGSELDIRADIAGLATTVPELADRLTRVRDRLTTPMLIDLVGAVHDNVGRNNRVQLWSQYDELIAAVRELPGHADFLRPPSLAELRTDIQGGFVVLLTATANHGDAIVVTGDADPIRVALPQLTSADIQAHAQAFLDATSAPPLTRAWRTPRVLTDILGWLWESAVEPVLAALPRQPRIWWLPTGMLGLFPLHAAGVAGHPGALDLALSSYIPTLRALQHARQRARPAVRRQLIVALEHTPDFPSLPGTAAEAAALHTQHPNHPLLTGVGATASAVAAALTDCTWAHFACHASADPNTSSQAALHLHHGELSVETIGRLRLETAELAYLSACSTAARGRHTDEPLNLASAFHLAGFRHVIASLWHLDDTTAAQAAQAFYGTLPDATSAEGAADALRTVARELRTQHPDRPDLWAALIHSGP
nr:hypothetical protein [Kibdelosporangium sp. MJ126-NF4]CTQ98662.1 hypothetical protein [Kibdelosporangium sp. MJ126-NF4]